MYTQHTPALVGLLERLARSKLPEMDYPRVDRNSSPQAPKVVDWWRCCSLAHVLVAGQRGMRGGKEAVRRMTSLMLCCL